MDRSSTPRSDLAVRPVNEPCDEILDRMAPDLTDDLALLALRVRDVEPPGT